MVPHTMDCSGASNPFEAASICLIGAPSVVPIAVIYFKGNTVGQFFLKLTNDYIG